MQLIVMFKMIFNSHIYLREQFLSDIDQRLERSTVRY